MSQQRQKSQRVMAWITPQLRDHLEQIVRQRRKQNPSFRLSDLLREALRAHVDAQVEVLGSRAHATRTVAKHIDRLQTHITQLEKRLALSQQVLVQMVAITAAVQLEQQGKNTTPQQLIQMSIQAAQSPAGQRTLRHLQAIAGDEDA